MHTTKHDLDALTEDEAENGHRKVMAYLEAIGIEMKAIVCSIRQITGIEDRSGGARRSGSVRTSLNGQ